MGEQEQPVILGENLEEALQGNVRCEQEQAQPERGGLLYGLGLYPVPPAQDDGGGTGGGYGFHEVFIEGFAVGHSYFVGGDPAFHGFVYGEAAHPSGGVAGKRAVGLQLF